MPGPDQTWLDWARSALGGGEDLTVIRALREGGAPWLLREGTGGAEREFVLASGDRASILTEVTAARYAREHGISVPTVLAERLDDGPPLVLVEAVAGSSSIPVELPRMRLRALGAAAAAIHAVPSPSDGTLPRRTRPIEGVDFEELRRSQPARALLRRAEVALAERSGGGDDGFVHGDLWQGNVLWRDEVLAAIIDWDCAGFGPAGVDLGSLRCDAAVCFGPLAADDVLDGWEDHAGRAADDLAYWDVVAALSTPPDMGWFPDAIADQGRPDLSQETLIQRRDDFLSSALDRLE